MLFKIIEFSTAAPSPNS